MADMSQQQMQLKVESSAATDSRLLPDIFVSQGDFTFAANGDTYSGDFEGRRKDRAIRKHGAGVYTTWDKQVYTTNWSNDKFGNSLRIQYPDGCAYEGSTNNENCYEGKGVYTFPEDNLIRCNFTNGTPSGTLRLVDANRHVWSGQADLGGALLTPRNHFFDFAPTIKGSPPEPAESDSWSPR